MTTKFVPPQEKKLKTLRKILWSCFAGIAIPSIILLLGIFPLVNISRLTNSFSITALVVAPFLLIGGLGVVCLAIYYIFKYRLEKDDELFL